jgi:hypothetical protein
MRIDKLRLTGVGLGQPAEVVHSDPVRREAASPAATDANVHVPSSELAQWSALATQEPEVRDEAVARASERLAAGEYGTLVCAERTACAILKARE